MRIEVGKFNVVWHLLPSIVFYTDNLTLGLVWLDLYLGINFNNDESDEE